MIACLSTRRDLPIGTLPNLMLFLKRRYIAHDSRRFEGDITPLLLARRSSPRCRGWSSVIH